MSRPDFGALFEQRLETGFSLHGFEEGALFDGAEGDELAVGFEDFLEVRFVQVAGERS
jgi:hypothetical protein